MLAAQLTDRHTAFGLAQNCKNLGFAISRHLHQNLLRYLAEKILLPHPLSFGGGLPNLGAGFALVYKQNRVRTTRYSVLFTVVTQTPLKFKPTGGG